ncbi:FtsK/SpoIIIE domain-containing protein [Candidatus Saccharibacteria bacterium]|nr:FtsK/SpoIIIE domain-containing protein [Candidatus Saccharibacteria bacterium]
MSQERLTLSYSSIICFLNNQIQFKKRYIAKVYDDPTSPAMVVGKAIHKMIEERLKGQEIEIAIQSGLQEIENVADYEIEYGKTGSRDKILAEYQKLSTTVINELPHYDNILAVEDKVENDITILGKRIPMKSYVDLVQDDGECLDITDFKTVSTYSDEESENYRYLMQGWVYTHQVEGKYKKPVRRVIFCEIKKSINRDGQPQIKSYILDRAAIDAANDIIGRVIKSVSDYIENPAAQYFPNPSDMLNGQRSMEIVAQMEGINIKTIHTTERREKYAPVNTVVAEDTVKADGNENERIMAKLAEFGIGGKLENVISSNSVDTYILRPNRGVKMSKIATLGDDLALALGSEAVRVVAPIYGTQTVGIEVPKEQQFPACSGSGAGTFIPIGVDTMNNVIYDDLAKMPHMLIGGQTGSGKSVFIRNIIMSLKGCDVTVVDCKMVDFADLDGEYCEIIDERSDAIAKVSRLVKLMDGRYRRRVKNGRRKVLVIDEYADLIMGLPKEHKQAFETGLCRLLQKARAANINVIIATQRPSADIVAPIIKANCPVKACLRVATGKNSEIIIDQIGGEKLLGKGDMLYLGTGMINPVRVQAFAPIETKGTR